VIDPSRIAELHADELRRFRQAHPRSIELLAESAAVLLDGVPMNWMRRWPGGLPVFVAEAEGSHFVDVDGHEYVDLCLGDTGAMTGHRHIADLGEIARGGRQGITTMLPTEDAAWVGAELRRRFGMPWWQLAMTATDANRFVIRLARHATGRQKVLVFNWCYHGTVDEALHVLDGGRVVPRPGNVGPPVDPALTTRVVEFNDVDALEAELAHGDVAVVLCEPALTNIGIVLPDPGFHDALRALTRRHGTLLAVDETHTICVGPGGATAAWGLDPDALVVGKTIGGGVPVAAYGLSTEFAQRAGDALGGHHADVSGIGGTLTGSALALAAVRATLSVRLRDDDFARTVPLAARWASGVATAVAVHGLDWFVQQLGARAEYGFGPAPRDGGEAAAQADPLLDELAHLWALNRGILLTPFHLMALMAPTTTDADVDRHTAVFGELLDALR
jgi:glutamate-1-semialdehyde 2,1-aminomutase